LSNAFCYFLVEQLTIYHVTFIRRNTEKENYFVEMV